MEWAKFNTHGESCNRAFEVMCNILFEGWCKNKYEGNLKYFHFVNGSGGDGGVEAYGVLDSDDIIGVQAKWFPNKLGSTQLKEIENSFCTAVKVRPKIRKYIVCIPRNLTSERMTKGNKIANDTEESKWLSLVEKFKQTNSDVSVELWDETAIEKLLMTYEAMGCYKYWFDNTSVFDKEIISSFEKAINSWAKTKYIPDLYSTGYIHEKLDIFTGNYNFVSKRYDKMCKILSIFEKLKKAYNDILKLKFYEREKFIIENIKQDIDVLDKWIFRFQGIKRIVADGVEIREDFVNERIKLNCTAYELKNCSLYYAYYSYLSPAVEILENIVDEVFECCQMLNSGYDNRIIFLGNQGTGKTAGIVAEINNMLQEKSHLPILVHAKDFTLSDNWQAILIKTLGFSSTWGEKELLKALENAALLRNKSLANRDDIHIQPKCLICVDGIEEAASWDFWRQRLEEAKIYEKDFANIRFVFLARPYVFKEYQKLDYNYCFSCMPSFGDVPVSDLFDKYISYYNIDINGNNWIKGIIRTPMALKLFCDIYKEQRVGSLPKNSGVITELFKEKINSIETEYRKLGKETDSQSMVMNILILLANKFVCKENLSYDEIIRECNEPIKSHLEELLKFVEEEGFIYSRQIQKDDFSALETIYSWGMQPAFDYLIARKLFNIIKTDVLLGIEYTDGIYQMLSLIALEEDNKLIFKYPSIKLPEETFFDLVCYALANTSAEIASRHHDYVKNLMKYSEREFRDIFDKIVLPVSNIPNHPLGSILLDEFLREFKSPAERDIWWSIPAYLKDNFDAEWRGYTEIDTTNIKLSKDDQYLGKPLILAWRLSSVNNDVRRECRMKLIEWGIDNEKQFLELLIYCANINDEQIIEDIFSVAYGIALCQSVQDEYLLSISDWIMENVFSDEGLIKYENVVVRYYCANIVKMAIYKEIYDKEVERKLMPPYDYQACIMPACKDALNANRMSGYVSIGYELARYVLCDDLDCFFGFNYETNYHSEETKKLIKLIDEYKQKYNVESLKTDGLIISVVYQYLLNQGWNKKIFWEHKDKKNIGVDIAIRRTFYPSTYGIQSKVMSVAEKYVWCAKHRIEAMLANRIISNDYGGGSAYINDYSDLENFTNTYQDYVNSKQNTQKELLFHADLAACFENKDCSIESIEAWMTNGDKPKFSEWIRGSNNEEILYAYTDITNDLAGIEETIWISSGIIKIDEFDDFVKSLNVYWAERQDLINVNDFHAWQKGRRYCTPQEACTVQSHREVENSISVCQYTGNLKIYKMVTECITEHTEGTENIFALPSRLVRKLTGVTYGDGYKYLDKKGNLVGRYIRAGENWKAQQNCLLMDKYVLKEALDRNQYKMFWLFRVYRAPSHKAYEVFGDQIMHSTDRSFAVWFDDDECKAVELQNIEPPHTGINECVSIANSYL